MSARSTLLALVAALAPAVAHAQFATTNVQALYGLTGFEEKILDYNTRDGNQLTLTVNHFSTWKYGDNFAFVDMYRGDYPGVSQSTIYAEWHPRFFVNKMVGHEGNTLGIFANWGPAFEVNQGKNFWAYLAGIGCDIALPIQYSFLSVNVFYRQDSVQLEAFGARATNKTWQLSPSWGIPFSLGPVAAQFAGFVDITQLKDFAGDKALDVMAQPQLLFDVGSFGGAKNTLWLGVEWYLHHNSAPEDAGGETVSAPQVMLQWNLH